jgi:hypothetical protein
LGSPLVADPESAVRVMPHTRHGPASLNAAKLLERLASTAPFDELDEL